MRKNLTIVGPEASDEAERPAVVNRVHIESLLLMAKYDDSFRERLISARAETLDESGIQFTPGERFLLQNIPGEKLSKTIEEFSVPGIAQSSLRSWRTAAAVLALVASVLFSGPGCRSVSSTRCYDVNRAGCVTEGWVNDDTFRVHSEGVPRPSITDIDQRKKYAKESAVMMAQRIILEKFRGNRLEGAGVMVDFSTEGINTMKEFGDIVKSGKVLRETFDAEQNCEIIYEVMFRGLKKKVQGGM